MRKKDLFFLILISIIFVPFFLSDNLLGFYSEFNKNHGLITAFLKFAILATIGESIGLRIKEKVYIKKRFGLLPRAIVWGFLGITIKIAFVIFASGTPVFLIYMGVNNADIIMQKSLCVDKFIVALAISVAMNIIYAPVMMTIHKITDIHIVDNGGTVKGLFTKIKFVEIFSKINWDIQWNFIFKKTIPFFWIPAHTITFLLPTKTQVLFAALLGIALGVILAFASSSGTIKK